MSTYVVLRTIADDGTSLIHLPTAERIVSTHESYWDALDGAKKLRTATWRHKKTGEERRYSALDTDGCAYKDDQTVWDFVSYAEYVPGVGGYALPIEEDSLYMYEPRTNDFMEEAQ